MASRKKAPVERNKKAQKKQGVKQYEETVTYTPESAMEILDAQEQVIANAGGPMRRNRAVSDRTVRRYADDMKRGLWRADTGESIKFSVSEILLDGQHRLWAVVYAKTPVAILTRFNLPDDVFAFLNTGKLRSNKDIATIYGVKNSSVTSAALRYCYQEECGNVAKSVHLPNYLIEELLQRHAGLVESARIIVALRSRAKRRKGLFPHAGATYLHYRFSEKDPSAASDFWEKLYLGENLTRSDPVYALRERCVSDMVAISKLKPIYKMALAAKAWNSRRSGRKLRVLKWLGSETFPTIE